MSRRTARTPLQVPLFDLDGQPDAHPVSTDAHAVLKASFQALLGDHWELQAIHNALKADHGVLLAAVRRLTTERDILSAPHARLQSENQSLRFQLLLQQSRTGRSPDVDTLLRELLKASHPDRWSQGQAATELAHEMAVALNAARARYHDA